ncbi:MAG: iron-containing alcohol dehydrogenase [Deltaproteobacteria bacterium]|nr:iron-containing alcohol dehydrogenase [Deltaproteobacteria bacterium]
MSQAPFVPRPTTGRGLLASLPLAERAHAIVHTQPEPWALVREHFDAATTQVHQVTTMEHADVRAAADAFADARIVYGIGGGSALDHAKYTAWRRGLPLVLMPTILSVDAGYTRAVGVREGGRVRYVGDARPERLLVDFDVLRQAPAVLNRAGAGDILSIFTALWDWRAAAEANGEPFDPQVAAASQALLDRLFAGATELRDLTDAGLGLLSDLYVGEVVLCEQVGNSRPEEGSEHYIAYALESRTGRHYVHGQLIGLCVLLAATWQGQDTAPVIRFLRDLDLDCTPEAVGTTPEELTAVLAGLPQWLTTEPQLLPGVFHLRPVSEIEAGRIVEAVVRGTA